MELEFADVTNKGSESSESSFLQVLLPSHVSPRAGLTEAYLSHPCIHLYVKSDVLFLCVTGIGGLLEVNLAELRVVENHRKRRGKISIPSNLQNPCPGSLFPQLEISHPCHLYLSLLSQQIHGQCWERMVYAFNSMNYFQLNEYSLNLSYVPSSVKNVAMGCPGGSVH